jgi:hypothetical protein
MARYTSGTVKSYTKGNCEIVLRVGFRSEQIDLIFHVIPKRIGGRLNSTLGGMKLDSDVIESHEDRCNQGVLVPVTHVVECPQKKVPSFVRAEGLKERANLFRDGGTSIHFVGEFGLIPGERKITGSDYRTDVATSYSAGVHSVVQGGTQITDGISSDAGKPIKWNWPTQAEFVDIVSGLRVCFDNYFVRVFGVDSYYPSVQIIDVILCPVDL